MPAIPALTVPISGDDKALQAAFARSRAAVAGFSSDVTGSLAAMEQRARMAARNLGEAFDLSIVLGRSEKSARQSAAAFEDLLGEKDAVLARGRALVAGLNDEVAAFARYQRALTETADLERKGAVTAAEAARLRQSARASLQAAGTPAGSVSSSSGPVKSARDSAAAFETAFAEQDRLAASAKAVRASIDPASEAQDRYNTSLAHHSQLAAAGLITTEEMAKANGIAKRSLEEALVSLKRYGGGVELNRAQVLELGHVAKATFESLASGAPVFTILTQQGLSTAQALSMGSGGVGGSLKAIGSGLGSLFTLSRMAAGGVAAIGVAAVVAYARWESAQTRLANALNGRGRGSGLTLGGINGIAGAGSRAGGLSISEGMALAAQMASTGAISGSVMEKLLGSSRAYARLTGQDLAEAGQDLARAFSDPVKGAQLLDDRIGILDGRTRQLISSLSAAGNVQGAQNLLFNAYNAVVTTATDNTWRLSTAWHAATGAVSDFFSAIGQGIERGVNGLSPDEAVRAANHYRAAARARAGGPGGIIPPGQRPANPYDAIARDRAIENTELANRAAMRGYAEANRKASLAASDVIGSALPALQGQLALSGRAALLESAIGNPEVLKRLGFSLDEAKRALAAINREKITASGLTKSEMEANQIAVLGISARTAAERELVEVLRTRQSAEWQAGDATRRAALEAAARATVRAQAAHDSQEARRSAEDTLAMAGLPAYQRDRLAIENRYRDLERLNGSNADLTAGKAAELAALRRSSVGQPLEESRQMLLGQIALLRVQARTFGESTSAMAAAAKEQELHNGFTQAGIILSARETEQVHALAQAYGAYAQAQEEVIQKQQAVVDAMDSIRDSTRGAISDVAHGIAEGKSGRDILRGILGNVGGKLIDSGSSLITKGLLGEPGKPGGGLLGDELGGWIRKALDLDGAEKTVASMQVQAATVMINGGVSGGLGLPGVGGSAAAAVANGNAPAGSLAALIADPKGFWSKQAAGNTGLGLGPAGTILRAPLGDTVTKSAFLDAVAAVESGGKYNIRYGGAGSAGKYFDPARGHPNVLEMTPSGLKSSAAGAYQITGSTYRQYGGGPFDPLAQRDMAWRIAQDRSGLGGGLDDYLARNGLDQSLVRKLGPTWQGFAVNPDKAMSAYQSSLANPLAAPQFDVASQGLSSLAAAAGKLPSATEAATTGLGTFGGALGQLGSMLGSAVGGNGGGLISAGGGLLGKLLGGLGAPSLGTAYLFADGGVMTSRGALPLRRYADGGVAHSPQLAMFGEGSGPEAYVPLKGGAIPVRIAAPTRAANSNAAGQRAGDTFHIQQGNVIVQGDASEKTIAQFRAEMDRNNRELVRHMQSIQTRAARLYGS